VFSAPGRAGEFIEKTGIVSDGRICFGNYNLIKNSNHFGNNLFIIIALLMGVAFYALVLYDSRKYFGRPFVARLTYLAADKNYLFQLLKIALLAHDW